MKIVFWKWTLLFLFITGIQSIESAEFDVRQQYQLLLKEIKIAKTPEKKEESVERFRNALSQEILNLEKISDSAVTLDSKKQLEPQPQWELEKKIVALMTWKSAFETAKAEKNCSSLRNRLIVEFAPQAESEKGLPYPAKAALETCRAFSY